MGKKLTKNLFTNTYRKWCKQKAVTLRIEFAILSLAIETKDNFFLLYNINPIGLMKLKITYRILNKGKIRRACSEYFMWGSLKTDNLWKLHDGKEYLT